MSESAEGDGSAAKPAGAPAGAAPYAPTEASLRGVSPADFWTRIKEHKVLQWGLAYLGAALAIAHGGELLGSTFHWPEIVGRLVMGALAVGLPIALALAWYHGHRSLRSISAGEATIISILLLIGAGLLFVFARPPEEHARVESAPIPRVAVTAQESPAKAIAVAAPQGPSIAVLPFINMSSDSEQEYFSDGLSEELLNQLAHLPNLRVIGRTSSFAFKGKNEDLRVIGETLGVNHILEGSVRKSGNRVRITAQLIDPANGSHLWSDVYDRKLGDIFAIQEEIARTVAATLRIAISAGDLGETSTHNLEAYDLFLRAHRNQNGPGSSFPDILGDLERAVTLDPQFTAAWVSLVDAYGAAIINVPARRTEWVEKQNRALNRALQLAPDSASVNVALASRALTQGKLAEAERLLASVKDLPPGLSMQGYVQYSTFLLGVGRPTEAASTLEHLRQAEPLAPFPSLLLQIAYETRGDFDRADTEYARALAIPGDDTIYRGTAVVRAMGRGDANVLRKAAALLGSSEPADINGAAVERLDDPKAALAELRRIFNDPHFSAETFRSAVVAQWAAHFGDPVLSLQALRSMPRVGGGPSTSVMFSLWRPVEKDMRRLPAFKDFVRELGLVDYWRATGKWGEFCHPVGDADFACI